MTDKSTGNVLLSGNVPGKQWDGYCSVSCLDGSRLSVIFGRVSASHTRSLGNVQFFSSFFFLFARVGVGKTLGLGDNELEASHHNSESLLSTSARPGSHAFQGEKNEAIVHYPYPISRSRASFQRRSRGPPLVTRHRRAQKAFAA